MKLARTQSASPLPFTLRFSSRGLFVAVFFFLTWVPASLTLFPAVHAADWRVGLEISVPYTMGERDRATQLLGAGVRPTAQDAFDNSSDTISLGSAILSAYFYHPEDTEQQRFLVRDFRSDRLPQQWELYINSNQEGRPVTMTWTLLPTVMGRCLGVAFSLTDVTAGSAIDVAQASYAYPNSAGTPRHFQLRAEPVSQTPPQPPLDLVSRQAGPALVELAWTGGDAPALVGYHVYRKSAGASAQRLTSAALPTPAYRDEGLSPGSYTYQVTAVTATGCESGPSNELAVSIGP